MTTYEALDPCSDEPSVERIPLAQRPAGLDGLRVALIQTMPPGSGLEPVIDVLRRRDLRGVSDGPADSLHAQELHGHRSGRGRPARRGLRSRRRRRRPCRNDGAPRGGTRLGVGAPRRSVSGRPFRDAACGGPAFCFDRRRTGADLADRQPTAHHRRRWPSRPLGCCRSHQIQHGPTSSSPAGAIQNLANGSLARGSLAEINETFLVNGWTDGLPIIPPTRSDVDGNAPRHQPSPDTIVTRDVSSGRSADHCRDGCDQRGHGGRPARLPPRDPRQRIGVRRHPVRIDDPLRELVRVRPTRQRTRSAARSAWPVGSNALGPGNRANATIGRTLNLMLRTLGGAQLGVNATPAQGSAVSWAFAFAENEDREPVAAVPRRPRVSAWTTASSASFSAAGRTTGTTTTAISTMSPRRCRTSRSRRPARW